MDKRSMDETPLKVHSPTLVTVETDYGVSVLRLRTICVAIGIMLVFVTIHFVCYMHELKYASGKHSM